MNDVRGTCGLFGQQFRVMKGHGMNTTLVFFLPLRDMSIERDASQATRPGLPVGDNWHLKRATRACVELQAVVQK